jgi:acetyltransferase-like isoleucine patch superfamily enzyme
MDFESKFVKNLGLNISIFGFIYFFSNLIPVLSIIYFWNEYFFPLYLHSPNFFQIFLDIQSLLTFLFSPLFLIFLILINLFVVILITKISYKIIQYNKLATEGNFHWKFKDKNFNNYFKRSFILRYAKWKIQRSPFPWLIKPAFNFIGNCYFGKNTVIENSYIAKELLHVGKDSYLGKALLANHLWDKTLTIKGIIIGDNVEISDNCCVAPGTVIENDVTLLPLSTTSKSDKLTSNSVYNHSPLKKISREELTTIIGDNLGD